MSSQREDKTTELWTRDEWSIYRNALPLQPNRIDITRLEGDFAYALIDSLLKGRVFEMMADPPFPIAQELQSIYF